VAFNGGNFFAGLIGLVGDTLSAAVLSYFGGQLMKGVLDNMIFGALANTFMGFLVSWLPAWAGVSGVVGAVIVGFVRFMMSVRGTSGGYGFFAGGFAAPVAGLFSQAATSVGERIGSKPSDISKHYRGILD
jgi:hypothetical protein